MHQLRGVQSTTPDERHEAEANERLVRFVQPVEPVESEHAAAPAPTGEDSTSELSPTEQPYSQSALFTQPGAVALLTFAPSEACQPSRASRSPPLSRLAAISSHRSHRRWHRACRRPKTAIRAARLHLRVSTRKPGTTPKSRPTSMRFATSQPVPELQVL
jgi:hypothetical protein